MVDVAQGNFNCEEFFFDFGDCEVQTCTAASVDSVLDCDDECAPLAQVGDRNCSDVSAGGGNFNCEKFFFDLVSPSDSAFPPPGNPRAYSQSSPSSIPLEYCGVG